MGVREYDPTAGRFTSVDPLKGDPYNPQQRNRYQYTGNNPLVRYDLNGMTWYKPWTWFSNDDENCKLPPCHSDFSKYSMETFGHGVDAFNQDKPTDERMWAAFLFAIDIDPVTGLSKRAGKECLEEGAEYVGKKLVAESSESVISKASNAAYKAAENADNFTVSAKHLSDAGGRWAKFAQGVNTNQTIREALLSPDAQFYPNDIESSYKIITNLGRPIGTKGERNLTVIVGEDGNIWTAYPTN